MTREDLTPEKQKEYDAILEECRRDMEENVPKPRATFDCQPDLIRRGIADKYLPRLHELLEDNK